MSGIRPVLTALVGLVFVCVGSPVACGESVDGKHDMLLLLPDGPLHLRVTITDGGVPLKQTREDYMARLVDTLDTDGDGLLSRSETSKHPLFASGRRFEGNAFLDSLRDRRPYSDSEIAMAVDRAAGQLVTAPTETGRRVAGASRTTP